MSTLSIRFTCPSCNKKLGAALRLAGRPGRCPRCNGPVAVPDPLAETPEPPLSAETTDYDFRPDNGSYYCTEVVGESYRKALGETAPSIGARPQHVPLLLDREAVVDPLDMFSSPDLQIATATKSANMKFDLASKTEKKVK